MGPKKMAAKRNPQARDFDRLRFRKREAEVEFNRFWFDKPVIIERRWELEFFKSNDFGWFQNFEERGWLSFAKFQPHCIPEVVREFCSNIVPLEEGEERGLEIWSFVRGKTVIITPDSFAELFGLPRPMFPSYPYLPVNDPGMGRVSNEILKVGLVWPPVGQVKISDLNDKYWPLHIFSCHNLFPLNRTSDCSEKRAMLLYAIGTKASIDLPHLLWDELDDFIEHPRRQGGIPFGGMLTLICERQGACLDPTLHRIDPPNPLNYLSFSKSRSHGPSRKRQSAGPANETGGSSQLHEDRGEEDEVTNTQIMEMLLTQNKAIAQLTEQISNLEVTTSENSHMLRRLYEQHFGTGSSFIPHE